MEEDRGSRTSQNQGAQAVMAAPILGPSVGYVDLLDHYTAEKLKSDHSTGKDYQKSPIRPSAAGKCTRELYYELMQYSKKATYSTDPIEPETSRIFGLGHSVEYHLIKEMAVFNEILEIRYKQQVLSFARLSATDPKLAQWLEGSLDLVLWSDKHKCVADVKSKKDKFSAHYASKWDEDTKKLEGMRTVRAITPKAFWVEDLEAFLEELRDPFFEANFRQLNLYACSDFLIERGIDHAAIIQYNKNDSRVREVRFKPSRALYDKTINRFQNVITAVDTNQPGLAPREYMLGSVKCAFCKFKNECWEGADAKREFFHSLPKKSWPKDTDRMGEAGTKLEHLLNDYQEAAEVAEEQEGREADIVKLMTDEKVAKVRTESGLVYELKKLKDGLVLRRSKA